MTTEAYHIESAYYRYTHKSVEDDIDSYEKFVDRFIETLPIKIYRESGHPLLWIIMDYDRGDVYRSWRYYKDDYNTSEDEYEEGLADCEAIECDVPRYIYEPSFIGELK